MASGLRVIPSTSTPNGKPYEKEIIQRLLPHLDVVIDVGANQGFYSCLASAAGKLVAAVEPEAGNLRFLIENAKSNRFQALEIFPMAIADRIGVVDLYGDGDTASLEKGWLNVRPYFRQSVPTNRLDHLFAHRWDGAQLLIKIDVEGVESSVIKGAAALVDRDPKPFWLIETFPTKHGGHEGQNSGFAWIFRQMFSAGYSA